MFNREKKLVLLFLLVLSATLSAQDQMTTLTTTGSGPSKEIAVQQSLRSAIEQAFGAFISAKTEILNDELVSDEITSVSSGNVQEYELLSEVYNPEASSYFVTVRVTVSVSKLTTFVESKGVEVEIKGGLFAANIIQQELNAKSEYEAIKNMLVPFHEAMLQAYDFNLTTSDPVLEDKELNKWKIALSVNATANTNFDLAFSIVENTLRGITLSEQDIQEYKKLGRDVYPVFLWKDNESVRIGSRDVFYLRNAKSKSLLDEVVEKHLDMVYGYHFDVLSNVHSYYSYPDVAVRLDTTQLRAVGHSIVIEGDTSSISRIVPSDEHYKWFRYDNNRFDHSYKVDYVKNWVKNSMASIYVDMPAYGIPFGSELDFAILMFRTKRDIDMRDILKVNDLRSLNGYSVKVSDNVFSHGNGGVTIRNGVSQLVLPLIEEEGSNCQCDTLQLEGYNDWQEASADVYLQLYEQYLWMYGPKGILTTSFNKEIVAFDSPYSYYHVKSELIPYEYFPGDRTASVGLRFERRCNYQKVDGRVYLSNDPAVVCVRLLKN